MTFISSKPYVVEIGGGLGNQMFQYAFYLKLKTLKPIVKLDVSFYENEWVHNGYELQKIFNITPEYCSSNDLLLLKDIKQNILFKLKRYLIGYRPSIYYEHSIDYRYKPEVFHLKRPTYLQGCWLSEKYFVDIQETVRNIFTFPDFDEERNKQLCNKIEDNNSVSVHIRRGDYLGKKDYQGICNEIYYRKAFQYIFQKV